MVNQDLDKIINTLFDVNFNEINDDEEEQLENLTRKAINDYGWDDFFEAANNYLRTNCKTPETVVNFANLYFLYDLHEYAVEDPYDFLAYFYYVIDFERLKYDADILDTIVSGILPASGYKYGSLFDNTWYTPEDDEKLIEAVNKLKNK